MKTTYECGFLESSQHCGLTDTPQCKTIFFKTLMIRLMLFKGIFQKQKKNSPCITHSKGIRTEYDFLEE